ncbi:MAG: Fur family transcriptional regulator [Candidatus Calescibacterium sp.]|jgi:Fe2+ or Zn2+ uptake regulation protein|nr:Fur family transcriptional regulator [Candidatus Calescibacterium sp.]
MNEQPKIKIAEELRKKGIKATPQRISIYKKITESCGHVTAEEIYERIKNEVPSLSLSTVYRTLKQFENKGIIFSLSSSGEYGVTIFDTNLNPHHHFICKICNTIIDIPAESIKVETKKNIPGKGEMVSVVIKGVCDNCSKRKKN